MKEIISLRKPREKHYLNDDGTFTLKMFPQDIHFLENGEYKEINNKLIEEDNYYVNKNNSFKTYFFKEGNYELYQIHQNNHFINISLISTLKNIEVNNNQIIYKNILENMDIQFDVISSSIKDTIFLKNRECNFHDLVFRIKTDLEVEQTASDEIIFKENGTKIYTILAPNLKDNLGNYHLIKYMLLKENDEYLLSFIIDSSILEQESLYPLVIDPTITNSNQSIYDTTICDDNSSYDYSYTDDLVVGVTQGNTKYRSLLKFDLPVIGTSYDIISAEVALTTHAKNYNTKNYITHEGTISVHRITSSWNESTANWGNMNDKYDERVEDFYGGVRSY